MAVDHYAKNPTLDNGVVVTQEYAKTRRFAFFTRLGAAGVLFVVMNLGWVLVIRRTATDRDGVPLDV